MLNPIHNQIFDYKPVLFENLLIDQRILSQDQINALRLEQQNTSHSQIILIAQSQLVDAKVIKSLLVEHYPVQAFSMTLVKSANIDILKHLSAPQFFKNNFCVPFQLDIDQSTLCIASVDTLNIKAHNYIQQLYQVDCIKIFAATPSEIFDILDLYNPDSCRFEQFLIQNHRNDDHYFRELCNLIIQDAASHNASDVHFDINQFFLTLRYRIDGLLIERFNLHNNYWLRLLNCLKVKSNLDMTETRLPQSGRFTYIYNAQHIDCRLSTHPTFDGECAVIRLLNQVRGLIPLDQLGFHDDQISALMRQCQKPTGLVIFAGPTGSGKTTSLYAIMQAIVVQEKNFITLEDPIEYRINNLRQSQINLSIGFDYKMGIKSILRQDPDVILIGEIRDESTALMAIRAAMTGHLVLTTLHVDTVFQIGQRFQDLRIQLSHLTGLIRCLVAQRLARCVCMTCRARTLPDHPCITCAGTGYRNRTVIAEVLEFDQLLDHSFISGDPVQFRETVVNQGFQTMHDCAAHKVRQGLIDPQEIKRVLG